MEKMLPYSNSVNRVAMTFLATLVVLGNLLVFSVQGQILIPADSSWKFLDNGSDQGTAWRTPGFDDNGWSVGTAEFGYGDGDETTVISFGPNASAKYTTTYYRRSFLARDPVILDSALLLGVVRDDGAVVYLNGTEVFRSNMPAGDISYDTFASGTIPRADEIAFQEAVIAPGMLVSGLNHVAVEIHQANLTSSDTSFNLRLTTLTGWPGAELTRNPYLQLLTPSSVVIRWRTDTDVASVVYYGTNATSLTSSNVISATTTEHELPLTGLAPNTKYFYSVQTATGVLAEGPDHYFITSPLEGDSRSMRFWVLGDSGTANSSARNVRDAYLDYTGSRHTDAILMLGDNAYDDGTDSEMQAAIYDMYGAVLPNSPVWPAIGNHDTAESSSPPSNLPHFVNWTLPDAGQAGGRPSGTEKYFSFNMGNVHFICLDSMSSSRSSTGAMANWLREDLSFNTMDWVIAYWHHAPYTRGSSNSDSDSVMTAMRTSIVPILEEGGVDLVLGGDSHSYERSFLIDGHYGVATTFNDSMKIDGGSGQVGGSGPYYKLGGLTAHQGTVYAVVGSSGQSDGGSLDHPVMYYDTTSLGSMVVDVDGTRLDATFVDSSGGIRDTFTIEKTLPPVVTITSQPKAQAAEPGEAVALSIRAVSERPITYQWRKDGIPVEGATNSVYEIAAMQASDEGFYDVVLDDGMSTAISDVVPVTLREPPSFVQPPVNIEVVEGGRAVFSVKTAGTLPMGYRWRNGGATLTNFLLNSHQNFFIIDPVRMLDAAVYTVVITNSVFWQPGVLSPRASLVVLPDTDGDLVPDTWEDAQGLNKNNAVDAALDADGDGSTNREEYEAGTDPNDPLDKLKFRQINFPHEESGTVMLEFDAVSNKTYRLEFRDGVGEGTWQVLRSVVAAEANRVERIEDPIIQPSRFYRLVTPW